MKRGKVKRVVVQKSMALAMALAMTLTMTTYAMPATVMAAEEDENANAPVFQMEGRGAVHDYGKSGDDPATPEDESAVVANSDPFKSGQYQESTKYSLKANGTPVSVYKYQKQANPGKFYHMDVARFSSDDAQPVFEVTVNDGSLIESVTIYPQRYYPQDGFQISEDKKTLTFQMSENLRYCILNINGTEDDREGKPQLAIINDPTETNKPDVNGANVLNFKTFADNYLAEHPVTDTVGEKCRDGGSVTDTSLNTSAEYTWEYGEGVYQDYWDKDVFFPNKRARLQNDVTDAFQAALKEVKESGTLDTIYFPAGTYVWSGLSIKDWDGNGKDGALNIYVDEDALLVNRMQECVEAMEPAIGIWNSSNITVSGRGVFDGNGAYSKTMDQAHARLSGHQGGSMVVQSQDITFNDTYLRDAKQWNWECHTGENITYNNIKGLSPYQHSWVDGLDLTSGKNITVNGAITMGNDDTFASGHFNPSDGFPQGELSGKDLDNLTTAQKNTAAAAGIYNKDRLKWDTKDSENFTINNTLGWSTFANAVRLGHNTKWKPDGGSYQMKNYEFNNVNTLHVQGWNPNLGGGGLSIQNGTNNCNPNYESLVFNDCSFNATAGGNSARFPSGNNLNNYHPKKVTLKNCWFKDASTPVAFRKIDNVRVEDFYVGGELVKYTSQVNLSVGDDVGSFVFLANGKPVVDNELPKITSLSDTIQAYAGNPLVFYVEAEDPDGDEIIIKDADVSAMAGASFDPAAGEFKWTPSTDEINKTYDVKFSVTDYTGTLVSKTVKIQVNSSLNAAKSYPVSEDAHLQSWKDEKGKNFGNTRYLTAVMNSKYGTMNEGLTTTSTADGNDAKVIYLKFDLSEIKKQADLYDKAELALTYIIKRNNSKGDIEDSIRVVEVNDSSWKEGSITWNNKPVIDPSDSVISTTFRLGTATQDKPSGDNQAINGGRAVADITKYIDEAIKADKDDLTLAVCETQGAEVYFVSREGASGFKNATEDMAPSILLNIPTPVDVEGAAALTVKEGYKAIKTNSFVIKGVGPFTAELICENAEGKITWNNETHQICIAQGLKAGIYEAALKITNPDGESKTVTFTLTVDENPDIPKEVDKTELNALYQKYADMEQGTYTDESYSALMTALTEAKAAIENESATEEQVFTALENLKNAAEGLVTVKADKTRLNAWIAKLETVLASGQTFTEESQKAAEDALKTAKDTAAKEDTDVAEVDQAWIGLLNAFLGLEDGTQKSGLTQAIFLAKALMEDPKTAEDYTAESIDKVKEALAAAEAVNEKSDSEYASIEEAQEAVNHATNALIDAVTQLLAKDYGYLTALIAQAEEILGKPDRFTPSSTERLRGAVDAAKKVVEDKLSEEEIDKAYNDLVEALEGLTLKGNKAELESILNKAKEILDNAKKYHPATLEGLMEAYDAAKKIFDDEDATQGTIVDVTVTLINEIMEARILGDVDMNQTVDTADAALIVQHSEKLVDLTAEQTLVGDVNMDGKTDKADASRILMLAAEKIDTL